MQGGLSTLARWCQAPEPPGLRRRPRHQRTRRHPRRHRGQALAAATPRTRL